MWFVPSVERSILGITKISSGVYQREGYIDGERERHTSLQIDDYMVETLDG